jgi:hypothetical protein
MNDTYASQGNPFFAVTGDARKPFGVLGQLLPFIEGNTIYNFFDDSVAAVSMPIHT